MIHFCNLLSFACYSIIFTQLKFSKPNFALILMIEPYRFKFDEFSLSTIHNCLSNFQGSFYLLHVNHLIQSVFFYWRDVFVVDTWKGCSWKFNFNLNHSKTLINLYVCCLCSKLAELFSNAANRSNFMNYRWFVACVVVIVWAKVIFHSLSISSTVTYWFLITYRLLSFYWTAFSDFIDCKIG